jgi:galacturan 1,4-alpha-galacturonidase
VKEWRFKLTPVSFRFTERDARLARGKRLASGEEKCSIHPSSEEGVLQMKALLGLKDMITNINMPNSGQIIGLPMHSVVETNALISRDSITPLMAGSLPEDVNILVLRQVANQETVLKASIAKDGELAFRAFANDPLMAVSLQDARKLFNEMLENTRKYLNGWKL